MKFYDQVGIRVIHDSFHHMLKVKQDFVEIGTVHICLGRFEVDHSGLDEESFVKAHTIYQPDLSIVSGDVE